MEYLVTMTTRVPEGTDEATVADVRAREAAHSMELAAAGHLLRLWRPPLAPGEWRTLGLFSAADESELGRVLSSMPLRVWRSDEVTALGRHGNDPAETGSAGPGGSPNRPDPGRAADARGQDFFTVFNLSVPHGTPDEAVAQAKAAERKRVGELAALGHIVRLWSLPDPRLALGLWRAADAAELQSMLDSLPLQPWMTEEITPLTPHPSDPGIVAP